jgi:CRP-like cAMP-binding protein
MEEAQLDATRAVRAKFSKGSRQSGQACGNRLLGALPPKEAAQVIPVFERVALVARQVLHHWNIPMEHVYFPESGLVSVMARVDKNRAMEVWLIGSDGFVGAPVVLGDVLPPHRRVVQIAGTALRMRVHDFQRLVDSNRVLRELLNRHLQLVLMQTSQSGACNAHHSVRQRLARWLLLARDALAQDQIAMPQQVLARLIGVRRATISECLKEIEQHSAVRTGRRLVEIRDWRVLQSLSCDCYPIIARERRRLMSL